MSDTNTKFRKAIESIPLTQLLRNDKVAKHRMLTSGDWESEIINYGQVPMTTKYQLCMAFLEDNGEFITDYLGDEQLWMYYKLFSIETFCDGDVKKSRHNYDLLMKAVINNIDSANDAELTIEGMYYTVAQSVIKEEYGFNSRSSYQAERAN